MEQWRWMPEDPGDLYVWVNIPEFTLRVVKNGEVIHTERVVTGLTDKQTPVFSENLKMIVFRPRWNVPNSIKVRELYPNLARGGTSFQRQGLRLSKNGRPIDPEDVDWGVYRHPPIRRLSAGRRRQRAGRGEVRLPQQARRLHARHADEAPVRAGEPPVQPRLRARAQSPAHGRDPARRGQGLAAAAGRRPGRARASRTPRF